MLGRGRPQRWQEPDLGALIAIYLACFRDHGPYLAKGEVGSIRVICADRDQGRTIMSYVAEMLAVPVLKPMVVKELAESFQLDNNVRIEVGTASYRNIARLHSGRGAVGRSRIFQERGQQQSGL